MLQAFNEKNRNLVVNINGRFVHRDEAGISPFDSVVAIVAYDEPTEQVQQYAPYTLTVNGAVQPGGATG